MTMPGIKRFLNERPKAVINAAIILVTLITFGALIPQLGYYQDDWYQLWAGQTRGAASMIDLFAGDRPFMGYIDTVEYSLLGNHLLAWHLYALALKVVGVLGFLTLLRQLWPERRGVHIVAGLIFAIYPGFLSQPIAFNFENHLLTYAAGIWAIVAGVAAIQSSNPRRRWLLGAASLLLTLFYIPIYEYMIGLEGVKLACFALAVAQQERTTSRAVVARTARWYAPQAVFVFVFLYWRFFLFESTRPTMNQTAVLGNFANSPLRSLLYLAVDVGQDFMDTVINAWSVPSYRLWSNALYREIAEAVLWSIPVVLISLWLLRAFNKMLDEPSRTQSGLLFLGAWSVAIALFPIAFAGREILFNGFERYTQPASIGVSLLLAGVLGYVRPRMKELLLLGLIFIGASTHILNARVWANIWAKHRDIYWQVSWRVPAFEPDTLVIVENFSIEQDYEVWAPLNLIYAPDSPEITIDAEITYPGIASAIQAGNPVQGSGRIAHVKDYGNVVIFSKPSDNACLHVVDGEFPVLSAGEDPQVANVASYSDLGRIRLNADQPTPPPTAIFGQEPPHDWCYYYQKISLARQAYDWEQILDLAGEAEALGLGPSDPVEWMPVFEALVNTGDLDGAHQPASILRSVSGIKIPVCTTLINEEARLSSLEGYDYSNVLEILCTEWDN